MPALDHPAAAPEPSPGLPSVLGGFALVAPIGQGGMGAVWKARQLSMQRLVALKVLRREHAHDARFIERFQREARACARIEHPHIVRGIDVGQDEASGLWYFAMELVEGPSLKQVLAREGRLPVERVLALVRDVALALDHAHRAGVVHRDVKPDNILLTPEGTPKLADLGLARRMDEETQRAGKPRLAGTPLYMSPEQIRGGETPVDGRADLYALGATAYHLLAGVPPFKGADAIETLRLHLREPPPRLERLVPQAGRDVAGFINGLLAKDPAARPADAGAVARTAADLLRRRQQPRRLHTRMRRSARRWGPALALLVLGVLGLGAWLALTASGRDDTPPAPPAIASVQNDAAPKPRPPVPKPDVPSPRPPVQEAVPAPPVADASGFELLQGPLNWKEAHAACAARGRRLAQPATAAEMQRLLAWSRTHGECWIGIVWNADQRRWQFADGTAVPYTLPWGPGQPDQIDTGRWQAVRTRRGLLYDTRPDHRLAAAISEPVPAGR